MDLKPELKDKAWKDLREFTEKHRDVEVTLGFDDSVMAYFVRLRKWVSDEHGYIRFKCCSVVCLEHAILEGTPLWQAEYKRELEKYGKV